MMNFTGRLSAVASLVLCAFLVLAPLGPGAWAQERLDRSALAGVTFPEPSWNWADDPGGARTGAVESAASVAGRECGLAEFHAWQVEDETAAERLSNSVEGAFQVAGWQIEDVWAEGSQRVLLAENGSEELVLQWLRIPDQNALAFFLCDARAATTVTTEPVPLAPPATLVEPAAEEDELDSIGFILGVGAVLALVGLGFVWNTVRHRRFATAAANWPSTEATVITSDLAVETDTDSDGDKTTYYVPRIRYAYNVNGRIYEGSRVRFGDMRFTRERGAREILERYAGHSTVDVRYDPAKPEEATIEADKPGMAKIVFGMVFLAASLVIVLAAAVVAGTL